MSSMPPRPPKVTSSLQSAPSSSDFLPPVIERSPKTPSNQTAAQKYLEKKNQENKQLFDSADYFLGHKREGSNDSAFNVLEKESNRLLQEQPRSSTLSFEFLNRDDIASISSSESKDTDHAEKQQHSLRRGSMEEFFLEENEHEAVKHAILEKPKLKRWDSGDFYKAPQDYRKMLATQAKEVLVNALEHAEEDHRPRRPRRSSLSKRDDDE